MASFVSVDEALSTLDVDVSSYDDYEHHNPTSSYDDYEHHHHSPEGTYNKVSFYDAKIQVTVRKKALEVADWIRKTRHLHRRRLDNLVIGLDVKWLRNFHPEHNHPTAILQLCVGRRCLIFQLLHSDYIPYSLYTFLDNKAFTFVGIGIKKHAKKLYDLHALQVSNHVELNALATLVKNDDKFEGMGLKRMADEILHKVMPRPSHAALSKWDAEHLDREQVEYACIGAFASFELGKILHQALSLIV